MNTKYDDWSRAELIEEINVLNGAIWYEQQVSNTKLAEYKGELLQKILKTVNKTVNKLLITFLK
jgi:hypothetical protein